MTHSRRSTTVPLIGVFALVGIMLADDALAQRSSPLEGQPAVRHRLLLVKKRLEIAPAFESSINADYKHTLGGGLKLEYHLSDMLSFGAVGFFNTSVTTGLTERVIESLPTSTPPGTTDPTPTRTQYEQHLNDIQMHGAAYISVTPWYGKLAAFGKAFVNFDFYFSGGVAFAQLNSKCDASVCSDRNPGVFDPERGLTPDNNPNNDPPLNDGSRVGLYLGGGIHVFLNNWIALDLTVRDYIFKNNPSGLDFNADLAVTKEDSRLLNHLFMGVGISIFFPTKPKRTP
jgi:outer membrane beta-barrel protein